MKSGLAALAIAMIEIKEENADINGTLKFMATVGEEVGELGSEQLTKEGINSIANINEFITRANAELQEVTDKYKNDVLGETAHSITIINGGDQVNSIPAVTTLQGNIRTIPEFDNGKVKAVLQGIVDDLKKREGFDLELIIDYDIYPVESKSDSELIKAIQAVSKEELPVSGFHQRRMLLLLLRDD